MSFEEDIQLKDLVAQTLETNGSLAKIRALLRSSIFCLLSEDDKISGLQPLMNNKIKSSLETVEGKIMFSIVRDFLEFFSLDCTLSVYESESYLGKIYQYQGRHTIAEELGLGSIDGDSHVPLLLSLIRYVQLKKNESLQDSLSVSKDTFTIEGNNIKGTKKLNCTYDLSNPTINLCVSNNEVDETSPAKEVNLVEKSSIIDNDNCVLENTKVLEAGMGLQTTWKDTRTSEKLKIDKNKTKAFSDTSPPQNNKPHGSDILPSLYNKEYKDKSGICELDKMFDLEVEYEEDLMISRDIPLQCDHLKIGSNNLLTSKNLKAFNAGTTEILSKLLSNSADLSDPSFQKDHSNNVKQ